MGDQADDPKLAQLPQQHPADATKQAAVAEQPADAPPPVAPQQPAVAGRPHSVTRWTEAHVVSWLNEIGLPAAKIQRFNQVKGTVLLDLTIQDLKDPNGTYTLTDLQAETLLRELLHIIPVATWSEHHVVSWLQEIGLPAQAQLNGPSLLALTIPILTTRPYGLSLEDAEKMLLKLYSKKPIAIWSLQEVGNWLHAIDLGDSRDVFADNGVDGPRLLALDKQNLTNEPYHLLTPDAVTLLRNRPRPISVTKWSVYDVGSWLDSIHLGDKKDIFSCNAVDGSLLLELDIYDLTDGPYNLTRGQAKKLLHHLESIRPCPDDESILGWTADQVSFWLDDIGLTLAERQPFIVRNVDGPHLVTLDIPNLRVTPYNLTRPQAKRLLRELLRIIPVATWSVHHVGFWLDDLGLTYTERRPFIVRNVDGPHLLTLNIPNLRVTPYNLTRLQAERLLRELLRIIPVATWSVHHVGDWLDDVGLIQAERRPFIVRNVDGLRLLNLDNESLTEAPYNLSAGHTGRLLRELLRIMPIATWRVHHVGFWLDDIGLGNRRDVFADNHVAGPRLLFLTIQNLGVPPYNLTESDANMLIRERFQMYSAYDVGSWIDSIHLNSRRQLFLDNHVDGPLLCKLDKEDLTDTSLGLTNLEAKKLLHHLEPIRPCPEEKRKVIREMIVHENTLYNLRATNFVVLQGFLFTAAALLMQSKSWLVLLIAVAGLFLVCATGISMGSSLKAIRRLMGKVYPGAREPKHDDGLPVIGFDSPDEKKTDRWCTRRKIMPLVFMLCWSAWILFFFVAKFAGK